MTYLDLADPACDVTSPAVHAAREDGWWVETSFGWAVLRYAEASALLRDRRFRQGNARWPEQNGLHSGPFVGWWKETLLSLEGDDHARLRLLLSPAFRKQAIEAMVPRAGKQMTALARALGTRRDRLGERIEELAGGRVRLSALDADESLLDEAVGLILVRPELDLTPDPPDEREIRGLIAAAW